ncbi:helix-turn-helix domain-containing protein [Micromonospora hortensis]|uniref:helix-turn-helix domain-containing protein n=1 Tax=Micromonospora hortensis TaxID=2911209 RepID=UPI001EE85027|nr:helix-turn-helix transcriptional regulator [Micromonospora hortensis]MCG5449063.1 helix-turn-helix transcriptional regulator [Micromonospora hortensis]
MSLLRRVIGGVLRRHRQRQGRTLREVAASADVSVPYLSEVERGRKEASSEVLAAICRALGISLADLLGEARDDMRRVEPRLPAAPRAALTDLERVDATRREIGNATLLVGPRVDGFVLHRGPVASEPTLSVGAMASAGGSRPGPRTPALVGCARARAGARRVTIA